MSKSISQQEKRVQPTRKEYVTVDEETIEMLEIAENRIDLSGKEQVFVSKLRNYIDNQSSNEIRISKQLYDNLCKVSE